MKRNTSKTTLIKHSDVFAKSPNDLGRTSVLKHKIDTGNSAPIRQRPRRPPIAFDKEEEKIIESQLTAGVIRESKSPWASPLVYVRKKDGTARPCVDYRKLNELTKFDAFPLPNMSDCLDSLGDAGLFSSIDLQAGYWQLEWRRLTRRRQLLCAEKACTSIIQCHSAYVVLLPPFNVVWS